jgi:hypothetical protein
MVISVCVPLLEGRLEYSSAQTITQIVTGIVMCYYGILPLSRCCCIKEFLQPAVTLALDGWDEAPHQTTPPAVSMTAGIGCDRSY